MIALASELRVDAWEGYADASRGRFFAAWCEENLTHTLDEFAGRPFVLEAWQVALMNEALAVTVLEADDDGSPTRWLPFWKTVVVILPRGNGKTTLMGALTAFDVDTWPSEPKVLLAASDEKQADLLFTDVSNFLLGSSFADRIVLRDYVGEIAFADRPGAVLRLATNKPSGLHGERPSRTIVDELHEWRTPQHRRSWDALASATKKRPMSQLFVISTAGEVEDRETGILGRLVDENEQVGEIERPHDGLTISRNYRGRTIVFNFSAPTTDPNESAKIKLANPASWITEESLAQTAASPDLASSSFLQLHAGVWSAAASAWIKRPVWDALALVGAAPKRGQRVWVGIDAAMSNDCTAIGWAWEHDDSEVGPRIGVAAHVWAAKGNLAAHRLVEAGTVDPKMLIPDFLDLLRRRFEVVEVVYDRKFMEETALELDDAGFLVADAWSAKQNQARAWTQFYGAVQKLQVVHDGDQVLAQHVAGAQAEMTEAGWHVAKIRQRGKIDALVAVAMAHGRAIVARDEGVPLVEVW